MFSSTRLHNKNRLRIDNRKTLRRKSNNSSSEEMKSRVAVRFFVAKSKRFDHLKEQIQQIKRNSQLLPECLVYVGLMPKNLRIQDREAAIQEKKFPDFQFLKPRVYECDYCNKVFFHKLLYRRHMIRHLKKIHMCIKCKRGFTTKIAKRRHDMVCRR